MIQIKHQGQGQDQVSQDQHCVVIYDMHARINTPTELMGGITCL